MLRYPFEREKLQVTTETDRCSNPHRGQYSDAVLSELENQNDAEVEGISAKVKMLKDVSPPFPPSQLSPSPTKTLEYRSQ